MKKIELYFPKISLGDDELISKLQGFLMEQISEDYADFLHQQDTNPYSMNLSSNRDESIWTVNLLTEEAENQISPYLLDLQEIQLKAFSEPIKIEKVINQSFSQNKLREVFQNNEEKGLIHIYFFTPTTFRHQGKYVLFPDTRLIFQSLMQKYTRLIEKRSEIEEETLFFLAESSQIVSYRLQSHYFSIHQRKIPAFKGRITIKIRGATTLKAYAKMLLRFGEYSGIGIKSSLGMGGLRIENRKN